MKIDDMQKIELKSISNKIKNKTLSSKFKLFNLELVLNGIAFYNDLLYIEDKLVVENNFLCGKLKIICTTKSNIAKVKFYAKLIVVKSTYYENENHKEEYSKFDLDTMIERAGRRSIDDRGLFVLMTEKEKVHKVIYL